jgi:hypothetical protein
MRFPFWIDQDVSRLYVAVEDTVLVRVMHSAGEPGNQFSCAADRHRLTPNELVERAAFNEFHAEVARPIALADFVNGNDIGIIQARCSLSLQPEPLTARPSSRRACPGNFNATGRLRLFCRAR